MRSEMLQMLLPIMLTAGLLLPCCLQYDPQSIGARWLKKGVSGLFLLMLWNALPGLPQVGMNPLSVMIAGHLGMSGTMALAILR